VTAALVLSADASAALTPSQYRARANAICATLNAEIQALGQPKSETSAGVADWMSTGVGYGRQAYAALWALHPPASLVAPHRRALWALWRILALDDEAAKQMRAGADPSKTVMGIGSKDDALFNSETAAWRAAGVTVCATQP